MTERKVSSERVSEIAAEYAEMASNLDGEMKDGPGAASAFYMSCSLSEIAAMASELLALRSSVKPVGEFTLDEEELATILAVGRNEQSGRITNYELKELVRVYRAALESALKGGK